MMAKSKNKTKATKKNYYITALLLSAIIALLLLFPAEITDLVKSKNKIINNTKKVSSPILNNVILGLEVPLLKDSTLFYYNKDGRFSLQYSEKYKIPYFVSYVLTKEEASKNIVQRHDKFIQDSYLQNQFVSMATDADYKRSGYDRGHMLPSADRNDSKTENRATFLYSNITPQCPELNRQTISRLEKKIRSWALKYDSLYVVTGSIIKDKDNSPTKTIGNGVAVPQYIYKVLAVKLGGEYSMIGFLLPNIEGVSSDYSKYIKNIDEIENLSGYDFFYKLPDYIEEVAEAEINLDIWDY